MSDLTEDIKKAIEEYSKDYAEWLNRWSNTNYHKPETKFIKSSKIELFLNIDKDDDVECSISFCDYDKNLFQRTYLLSHFELEELEKLYGITPSTIYIKIESNDLDHLQSFFDNYIDLFYINTDSRGVFTIDNENIFEVFVYENFKDFYQKFENLRTKLIIKDF